MKRFLLFTALAAATASIKVPAQSSSSGLKQPVAKVTTDTAKKASTDTTKPKKASIADKIKSSKKSDGLFTIYQDTATGSVQMFIRKDQLGKEFIYQSFS